MFVPGLHARVHITGMGNTLQKRNSKARQKLARRRVGVKEIIRMPCLMPTICVVFIGLLVLVGGAGMCVIGYIPDTVTHLNDDSNTTTVTMVTKDASYYATKSLSYAGPILMGCGFFAIIVSCVLYCEIIDRYAVLMPSKPDKRLKRQDLLEMILSEFKKSYFRGIEVPLRKNEPAPKKGGERQMETLLKALSISTPVLLMSPDLAPTWRFSHYPYSYRGHHRHLAHKPRHPKLKQLGGSGSSGHEPWLKTSSLPNICDPELRRHNMPRPVVLDQQQEMGRARRMKRFGRPSRSMENRISWSLPQTLSRSSSGVDNPAYLHEQDRKKSVSMCVHAAYSSSHRRPPGASRFIKASQLQPRVRLQQQQQQHIIQKQQQLQQQQQQQQQQKKLKKQHSSRDSDESSGRKRCDSEEARPRQRPKLVRTKGNHKSFDSSGDSSFSNLVLPAEPPPFPLPAHYMHVQQKSQLDTLQAVSPRTAKLLRAKCKSEDVRDKKKPDIMLLKDLFRSVDIQDPPVPPPTLITQMSSSSMPCTMTQGLPYLDPLSGKQCETVGVTVPYQDRASTVHTVKSDSAFVRVKPQRTEFRSPGVYTGAEPSHGSKPLGKSTPNTDSTYDQRYELPLLSGVAGTNRQWEAERRKKISSSTRREEKSHSLDAKDCKSSKLDVKRTEIHRAHSFNAPLGQETKPTKSKLLTSNRNSQDKEKDSSNFLRVFLPHPHKSRPKSWDGDKSQSLDTPNVGEMIGTVRLAVPRIERASSFDPMASPTRCRDRKQTEQMTSYSSEFVRPSSPYPCRLLFENESGTGRSKSDEIRQKTPVPSCLTLPVPLQPQRVHSTSPDRSSADSSTPPHRLPQPPRVQHLTVPVVQMPHRQPLSTQRHSPVSPTEITLKAEHCRSPREPCSPRNEDPVSDLKLPGFQPLKPPSPGVMRHSKTEQHLNEQSTVKQSRSDRNPGDYCTMKHSHTEQHLSHAHRQQQQRTELAKRRATIVHQASVHLSLDSFPDSSMSFASSNLSSTDNTMSSNVPLLPTSASTTPLSSCSVGGGGSVGSGSSKGVVDESTKALKRMRYTQSRSVAIEESSPENEDTENTPLIQNPVSGGHGPGSTAKS